MSEKDEQAQEQENVEGAEELTEETPEVEGHFFEEGPDRWQKPAGPARVTAPDKPAGPERWS